MMSMDSLILLYYRRYVKAWLCHYMKSQKHSSIHDLIQYVNDHHLHSNDHEEEIKGCIEDLIEKGYISFSMNDT